MAKVGKKKITKEQVSFLLPLIMILMGSAYSYYLISNLDNRILKIEKTSSELMDALNSTPIYDEKLVTKPDRKGVKKFIKTSQEAMKQLEIGHLTPNRTILCERGGGKKAEAMVLEKNGTFYQYKSKGRIFGEAALPPENVGKYAIQDPFILFTLYAQNTKKGPYEPSGFRGFVHSISNQGVILDISIGGLSFKKSFCSSKLRNNFLAAPLGAKNPGEYRKQYSHLFNVDKEVKDYRKQRKEYRKKYIIGRKRWGRDPKTGKVVKLWKENAKPEEPEAPIDPVKP